jgi:WD40 repeat protein
VENKSRKRDDKTSEKGYAQAKGGPAWHDPSVDRL